MKKTEYLEAKIRSIKFPVVINPGPNDLKNLWREAKGKSMGDPNICRFVISNSGDIYVWGGDRGMHRWVIRSIGEDLQHFQAFGSFRTEIRDPRKLDALEYVSKNAFMTITSERHRRLFMKIIHHLRLKKAPGFQDFAESVDNKDKDKEL